ncbi:MAG: DUF4350 domain-containing protein [Flavobacteriaceae bacterium]|nr:MAG: DUF4350 domain-containing protein [Flavobacteriaceae bacterium]
MKIYIGILLAAVALIIYMEMAKPVPVNWFPSYAAKHKIPYGTYILKNELASMFKNIKEIKVPPFIYLNDTTTAGTYFFLNEYIHFDKAEQKKLLDFVARGNDVFISSTHIHIDTLNIETDPIVTFEYTEKFKLKIVNKNLNNDVYEFNRPAPIINFSKVDTAKTTALGNIYVYDKDDKPVAEGLNFIKHVHGKGAIYLHTFPLAFTNYNMLTDDNYLYTANLVSYINDEKPLLWDAYYKAGKTTIQSQMHYILSSKNLKYAYYTALMAIVFFIIFKGKRDQRFIRVIKPLQNQTLAFTKTIAGMYYENGDHKNIAYQKINYFLEYIREKLHIPTVVINESFYKHLAQRSNNTYDATVMLFTKIKTIQSQEYISKEQLIALNTLIEKFKSIKK